MLPDWLREHAWWLAIFSAALGIVALLAAIAFLLALPTDYFLHDREPEPSRRHPVVRMALLIFKNAVGTSLLVIGGIMSLPLVPGPGLIMVLIGLSLMSFPGKQKLELMILRRRWVLRPLNWLRSKGGRAPLQIPSVTRASTRA